MRQNIKPYFVNNFPRCANARPRSDSDRLVSSYSAPTRAKLPGIVSPHLVIFSHFISKELYSDLYTK